MISNSVEARLLIQWKYFVSSIYSLVSLVYFSNLAVTQPPYQQPDSAIQIDSVTAIGKVLATAPVADSAMDVVISYTRITGTDTNKNFLKSNL